MTRDEFNKLKPGDQLIRLVNEWGSPKGFIVTVQRLDNQLFIYHKNGNRDRIAPDWWDIYKKGSRPKSGFGKFIKRVEDASKV